MADKQDMLQQARQHIEAEEFDQAESLCADVLVTDPVSVPAHQLMARVWLGRNEPDKVRDRIAYRDQLPCDEHYVEWGLIAEEVEDLETAVQIYEDLLKRVPENGVVLYRLGLICLERGERDRAVGLLQRALRVSPDHAAAAFELAQCYVEDELWGLAADAYERGLACDPDNEEARTALQVVMARMRELAQLPSSEVPSGEDAARRMRVLFSGREGVHARQWIDEDGRVGYSPVHEPLADHLLALHLQGTATLGVYPMRADQTVLFGAIDIDIRKSALKAGEAGQPVSARLQELVLADARRLARQFDELNLPVYVEDSGYKGVHLWLFFAEPVPAAVVKRFLEAVVQRVGPPGPELQWEVFPKQEQVAEDQLGNLIKLPLGIHLKTGRRCLFTDLDGQEYSDQEGFLQRVQQIDRTPPSPISCPRIRQRLPEVTSTVNCACVFDLPEGGYPSPLLHLDSTFTRGRSQSADRHGPLVDKYVNLQRDYQRLKRELAQLEDDLHYAITSGDQDELRAGGWILRRDGEGRFQVEVDLG